MDFLYSVGIILIFLVLLFWNYGTFACTVVRWCKPLDVKKGKPIKRPPLSAGEAVMCYIPLFQVCMVRKSLYGSYGFSLPLCITSGTFIILRLVNAFLIPINSYVMLVTTFMMWIGLILYFLLYGIVTFQCARMYEFSMLTCILCFLFAQLVCMFLRDKIADKMRDMHKEATFDEHHGDTVIKSRNSKR